MVQLISKNRLYWKYWVLLCLIINSWMLKAHVLTDSIESNYEHGKFNTLCLRKTSGNIAIANEVADYLVTDFQNSPGHLFTWALKGLGLQNKNNEVIIVIRSSNFDRKTNITHGIFDISIPGVTTFEGIKVDAIVTKTRYTSGVIKIRADIIYSSLLLKEACATMLLVPQKNNELVVQTDLHISFGWFFNLFITQNRYKNIVEWRINKFSDNIADECKRRQNQSN